VFDTFKGEVQHYRGLEGVLKVSDAVEVGMTQALVNRQPYEGVELQHHL